MKIVCLQLRAKEGFCLRYKIGDVARILGISRDLLRYYEKKGVVRPQKDKLNDYRYYDTWDINFLMDCLWYKQYGFGIDQIAHMVTDSDYDALLSQIDDKREDIQTTLRHQELLLRRITEHRDQIGGISDYLGKCDICQSPEILCYLNRYNATYDDSQELLQLGQSWLNYMPFTQRYFEISQEDLIDKRDNFAWGFSLTMDYAELFDIEVDAPVSHLPACRSIHSAFKSSGKSGFTPRHIDYMVEYAEANGLTICGNARGNLVCSILDEGRLTGYFEVWLPIKD